MIRTTLILDKRGLFEIFELESISKIEIKKSKNNFRNPNLCKIYIYHRIDNHQFNTFLGNIKSYIKLLEKTGSPDKRFITGIYSSLKDGFIRQTNLIKIQEIIKRNNLINYIPKDWNKFLE